MTSKTMSTTAKIVSAATALAASAGAVLGAGVASAQMSSTGQGVDQWVQQALSTQDSAVMRQGSGFVMKDLPEGAQPLPVREAKAALAKPIEAKDDPNIALTFYPEGRVYYYDGCNSGNASYEVDGRGAVHVGPMAETQRLCEPAAMDKADELKAILRANPSVYRIDTNTIALGAQGKAIEFQPGAGR